MNATATAARHTLPFNEASKLFSKMYRNLSYNTIYQHVVKHITNGGTLGFNPVSRWAANGKGKDSRKYKMLQYILNTYDHNKIIAAYEDCVAKGLINERFRDGGGKGHGGEQENIPDAKDVHPEDFEDEAEVDDNGIEVDDDVPKEVPASVNMDEVRRIAREEAKHQCDKVRAELERTSRVVIVQNARTMETKNMGIQHELFPKLLWLCDQRKPHNGARYNVWLPGPASSGKTTAAEKVAEALGLDYYYTGALLDDVDIFGFRSVTSGDYIETSFFKAFTQGGVFLWDEADGSDPVPSVKLNALLEQKKCAFPHGIFTKHEDFIFIAAANTFGYGADARYVGRNRLDAATLNRFTKLPWGYDEKLERAIVCDDAAVDKMLSYRRAVDTLGYDIVISTRNAMHYSMMTRSDEHGRRMFTNEEAEIMCFRDGMDDSQWLQVKNKARGY